MGIFSPVAAGVAVSIGCVAYLKTDMPWLFPIGLFIVCFYGLKLFTGRICYYSPKNKNLHELIWMFLWNGIAAIDMGILVRHISPELQEKAAEMTTRKLAEGFAIIPLAILCNVLIFVAVDSYKRTGGNPLGLIFATTIFVACGFEHCVANAFYFRLAGNFATAHSVLYLLTNAMWNGIGGILAYRLLSYAKNG